MCCYHPLKAFVLGTRSDGKLDLKVTSYDADHVEFIPSRDAWEVSSVPLRSDRATKSIRDFIEIPCGQCLGCRIDYSREWANRLMMERQYHDDAYFVTLTYNDLHLPIVSRIDDETGELCDVATLRKSDLQNFLKRLRKAFPDCRIRYYAAGEYGDEHLRPHYHLIIFGLHLTDLKFKFSRHGYNYYESPALGRVWSTYDNRTKEPVSIGRHIITDVSWETCAYTARYVMKKRKGKDAAWYETHCLLPEFCTMSLKPGIGAQYYADHPEIYKYDRVVLPGGHDAIIGKPPRYFDHLFDVEYPGELDAIKNNRRLLGEASKAAKLSKTSLNYISLLAAMEEVKKGSIKKLIRPLEE